MLSCGAQGPSSLWQPLHSLLETRHMKPKKVAAVRAWHYFARCWGFSLFSCNVMNNVIRAVDFYPYAVREKEDNDRQQQSTNYCINSWQSKSTRRDGLQKTFKVTRAIREHKHDVHTYTKAHTTQHWALPQATVDNTQLQQASQNKQASEYHKILSRSKHLTCSCSVACSREDAPHLRYRTETNGGTNEPPKSNKIQNFNSWWWCQP